MNIDLARFREWEHVIHPLTWRRQPEILAWAAARAADAESGQRCSGEEALSRHAAALRSALFREMDGRWSGWADRLRILLHLPRYAEFPAARSFQRNLAAGLARLGVVVAFWPEEEPLGPILEGVRPTLLLSIDRHWLPPHRGEIGDEAAHLHAYRQKHALAFGLTCNHVDPATLAERLAQCRQLGVDFFYSSHAPEFVRDRYGALIQAGFPVASCEFGANPMTHFPLCDVPRDLDFVFFGSANGEKWDRYCKYFSTPWREHPGLIVGHGWSKAAADRLPDDHLNHLYARARIGVNLHVPSQIALPTEINERAYNLAACGVPQVTDRPAQLARQLGDDAVFAADTPEDFARQFDAALAQPNRAAEKALRALEQVMNRHTVLHRADALLTFIVDEIWSR